MTRSTHDVLGFRCFKLVRADGDLVAVPVIETRAAMGVFMRPAARARRTVRASTRRARFQARVTTLDQIIRDALKLSA